MKTIEEFYNEVMSDKALADAAYKARREDRIAEFLSEHEVNGTAEEFNDFVDKKKKANRELSDDELEKASGGTYGYVDWNQDWSESGWATESHKVVFLFNVGDRVAVDCWFRNLTGTIKARSLYKGVLGWYPYYKIEFDIDTSSDWYLQDSLAPL